MQIAEILSHKSILCGENLGSKKAALERLSKLLAGADASLAHGAVFDCLIAREKLGSTGMGKGVAIPHGRLNNGEKTVAAFIQLRRGIDYETIDQVPVDLLFGLLTPGHATEEHLKILAHLAEMFSDPAINEKLRQANSSEELYEALTG